MYLIYREMIPLRLIYSLHTESVEGSNWSGFHSAIATKTSILDNICDIPLSLLHQIFFL